MPFIGNKPSAVPLTSADIADGIIVNADISSTAGITLNKISGNPSFRNIVINGDMQIAQRSTSVSSIITSGYFTLDRWQIFYDSLGTWTQSQSTDVPSGYGFSKSFKMDCTTADASPAASDRLLVRQLFEGQNLQYLKKGTANAIPLTLSFWVKSTKTGTFIAELFDLDNTRQVSKSYTVNTTNTWEFKTVTFPADTTGTLNNDNETSLGVNFWLGVGTDFTSGTLNTSWAASTNANRVVGQVNIADSTSNDWLITGVQLEAGTAATDFEFLPIDVSLGRCLRYFYQATDVLNTTTYVNGHLSGTTAICISTHPVTMRSSPTVTYSGGNFLVYVGTSSTTKTDLGTQTSPVSFRTLASSISGSSGNACHIDFSGGTINYSSEL